MSKEDNNSVKGPPMGPFPQWTPPPPLDDPDGPPVLTPEELERSEDYHWATTNLELLDRYPGQWVAVHKKKVLAVGTDIDAVIAEAEAKSGLPRNEIVIADIVYIGA
jgi:hypothetical protein